MWKRWSTWITLALLVWFNFVAWSIRTSPRNYTGVITLREHQGEAQAATEYTTLAPTYVFGSTWFSYAVALFIGFGLPFILPRLVPWLWRRGKTIVQRLRGTPAGKKTAVWLVLLGICNVLAWDVTSKPFKDSMIPSLFHRQIDDSNVLYTYLLPGLQIHSIELSYAISVLVAFGLPFLLPFLVAWLWRRLRQLIRSQPPAGEIRPALNPLQHKKRGTVLAILALFFAFNVLAWDWVESRNKGEISLVLGQRGNPNGWSYDVLYYGITPGILIHSAGVSWVLSFFVGEILPFLLAPVLFRRRHRPPPPLPLPPVEGAPR